MSSDNDRIRFVAIRNATTEWAGNVARRAGEKLARKIAEPDRMANMNVKPKSTSVGVSGTDVVVIIDDAPEPARIVMRREDAVRLAEALRWAARRVGAALAAAGDGRDDG